ncbi:NAD(P)/FAD-dependent oxidoreductase [Alkalicoccus urumqiensis]|uniref:FAD dependent oxidoreductase domain-containing protein n=1 Tax=Alkalicoccus urumqiensis TaxID=1548213 RepID=A0A2P6MHG2_ALKUR|nr:FAD-dependent oxidoreductase [Alkalicoccus urumqiensis]PRO65726.1 hypothetical protein C6I21_07445 [Alkalicoccus urumqiensis]
MYDLLVIGGGIQGLSAAWHAAQSGADVLVVEKGTAAGGATKAAAGMLGAQTERHAGEALQRAAVSARDYWKTWAAEIERTSGKSTGLRLHGAYRTASSPECIHELRSAAVEQKALGLEVQSRFPDGADVKESVFFPQEAQVDAIQAAAAIAQGIKNAGGEIREKTTVRAAVLSGDVWQVETESGIYQSRYVLQAPGISGAVKGTSLSGAVLEPVKGECLAVRPAVQPFKETIVDEHIYLVPKADGRIIIGATETPGDETLDVHAGAAAQLLSRAVALYPALADAALIQHWAGVRPRRRGGPPLVAETKPGLFTTIGHYRNGILYAGWTGRLLTRWMDTGSRPEELAPFSPEEVTK